MVTYNQLLYLVEVVNDRNFTKAAEKLYVSQSTLSKSIKALEAELDVEIIKRDSKNFALTDAGKEVYDYAQRVLGYVSSETNALKRKLHEYAGSLSVGIPPTAGPAYFYSRVYAFRQAYPDVNLTIEETPSRTILENLDNGKIDIGIVLEPFENANYITKPVCFSEIGICVSKNNPLSERDSVSLKELKDESYLMLTRDYMFRGIVDGYCRQAGFSPKVVFESSQWDMLYDMVSADFGIAFFPVWLMEKWNKPDVKILRVNDPEMPWVLSLCYLKNHFLTEPMKNFLELCENSGPSMN